MPHRRYSRHTRLASPSSEIVNTIECAYQRPTKLAGILLDMVVPPQAHARDKPIHSPRNRSSRSVERRRWTTWRTVWAIDAATGVLAVPMAGERVLLRSKLCPFATPSYAARHGESPRTRTSSTTSRSIAVTVALAVQASYCFTRNPAPGAGFGSSRQPWAARMSRSDVVRVPVPIVSACHDRLSSG